MKTTNAWNPMAVEIDRAQVWSMVHHGPPWSTMVHHGPPWSTRTECNTQCTWAERWMIGLRSRLARPGAIIPCYISTYEKCTFTMCNHMPLETYYIILYIYIIYYLYCIYYHILCIYTYPHIYHRSGFASTDRSLLRWVFCTGLWKKSGSVTCISRGLLWFRSSSKSSIWDWDFPMEINHPAIVLGYHH